MQGAALLSNGSHVYDPDSGTWINGKVQRIAELIADFNPELHVVWIPPKDRAETDVKPYGILHRPFGKPEYLIKVMTEEEFNEGLVTELILMQKNAPKVLEILEAQELAAALVREKEIIEMKEEERERAEFMFKSPLNWLRMGNGQVIRS